MPDRRDEIHRVLSQVLAPLIEADGGSLYAVFGEDGQLGLHLGGRFSGCPGNHLVEKEFIEPALRAVDPKLNVVVSSGALLPTGAVLIDTSETNTRKPGAEKSTRVADEA